MRKKRLPVTAILFLWLGLTGILAQNNDAKTPASIVTDIDGNVYKTVKIGSQKWMAENLKTTRYNNGDIIGTTIPDTLDYSSENTPKYQWAYNGKESNATIYGRLYTWYTITDSRGVCPSGWHVPSDTEWETLIKFLGGEIAARGKLKETGTAHWSAPNGDATNESGFTALPAGSRWGNVFVQLGNYTHFWSTSELTYNKRLAYRRLLTFDGNNYQCCHADKKIGWSVRCVKD